jgi:hypothetical protein
MMRAICQHRRHRRIVECLLNNLRPHNATLWTEADADTATIPRRDSAPEACPGEFLGAGACCT